MLSVYKIWLIILLLQASAVAADVEDILSAKIADIEWLASQANIVNAVLEHNKLQLSSDEVARLDQEWIASDEDTELKQKVVNGALGHFLSGMIGTGRVFNEFIVTDRRGVNVACFPTTTDYFQGDEEKWIQAFNKGAGAFYIGEAAFDESTRKQSIQVAVPIKANEQVIGVLIAGIQMTYIEYKLAVRKLNIEMNSN